MAWSNCWTLFGMATIPSDNYIRLMLDGVAPAAFDGLFFKAIEAAGPLTRFQCLGRRTLMALDGSEHHCSRKVKCKRYSTRRRSGSTFGSNVRGGTDYFLAFLGASIVAPGHKQVLPTATGIHRAARRGGEAGLRPQRRQTLARRTRRHCRSSAASFSRRRSVRLPADRHRHPGCRGNFILTCKPSSHKTIAEYLQGAELQEHREAVCKRGKRTTTIYRWLNTVPLRATDDAITVNWFSIETPSMPRENGPTTTALSPISR
jgi:hypothetical protein